MRKADWKWKMILSAVCGVVLIVLLLSGITYVEFIGRLMESKEKMVQLTFQETEDDLAAMMEEAGTHLHRLSNDKQIYQFYENHFSNKVDETMAVRGIVQSFDEIIGVDQNVYGVALVCGDGRTVTSSVTGSRQGNSLITEELWQLLENSGEQYPYINWIYFESAGIQENTPLYKLVQNPVLLGIRALKENEDPREDVYLFISLDEKMVEKSYKAAVSDGGDAVLADEDERIISATNKELLGKPLIKETGIQNMEYGLRYQGWKLVNRVPRKVYFADADSIVKLGVLLTIAAVVSVVLFLSVWMRRYTRPIQQLMDRMKLVGEEELDFSAPEPAGLPELDMLNMEFYHTVQKLKVYIERVRKAEDEKRKEELKALQYQINPHFLLNSLNSIRWMAILTDQQKVADSLGVLSKIFIPILRNPSLTWTLKDELEFVDNYVAMMKIRYGDIIEFYVECPKELLHEEFPRLILQPVIENCFVHRSAVQEIQDIYLHVEKEEHFFVTVRNTGGYIKKEDLDEINRMIRGEETESKSIGLNNIQKRLYYLYGEEGKLEIVSNEEIGVLVKITF